MYKKSELREFWDKNFVVLSDLFGTRGSFYTWQARHFKRLKKQFTLRDVVRERKKQLKMRWRK